MFCPCREYHFLAGGKMQKVKVNTYLLQRETHGSLRGSGSLLDQMRPLISSSYGKFFNYLGDMTERKRAAGR
jgi:hypothetical protein